MALCKRCDRCDNTYNNYAIDYGEVQINGIELVKIGETGGVSNQREIYDLCSECMESLTKWLKKIKEESKTKEGDDIVV